MPCKYCHEGDESKLVMRSSLVNGEVKHIWICLRCLWLCFLVPRFRSEGENGRIREARTIEEELLGARATGMG